MKKRIGSAYLASLALPLLAFAVLMLRVMDPHSRWLAAGLYALGWLLLVVAIRNHARMRHHFSKGKLTLKSFWSGYARHVGAGVAFLVIGIAMLVLVPVDAAPFVGIDVSVARSQLQLDKTRLQQARTGQGRQLQRILPLLRPGVSTDAAAKTELQAAWASYVDYAIELDTLLQTHKYFYQLNPHENPELASRSFLIGYAALVSQVHHGLTLTAGVDNNRNLETWLDEPNAALGLGADTYLQLRRGLTRGDHLLRLQAGLAYGTLLDKMHKAADEDADLLTATLAAGREALRKLGKDPAVLVDSPLDRLERAGFSAWFPLQKGVAVAMSDLRTTRRDNFVSLQDIEHLREQLLAGDVLLERRNWYLTNIGLPGFWPHAALYVGTPAELDAAFDQEARAATDGLPPSEYLKKRHPEAAARLAQNDAEGHAPRVIEAVGQGVILSSLEHSAHADYVAALRPRLSAADRLASVMAAFEHLGKPYDYDFDFVTDETVVCSELVFKALQPNETKGGIAFELTKTSGRLVLPPNNIAMKYDQEADSPERSLDFVAYYEGSEEEQRAIERSEPDFRKSWRRPKWDVAQP